MKDKNKLLGLLYFFLKVTIGFVVGVIVVGLLISNTGDIITITVGCLLFKGIQSLSKKNKISA
ncbi:MAG: hypothetical protein NTY80_03680 [candidate division SR1 bacterium]|nr:hypothetical protein [candidate division SR1 bacterium]